MFDARDNMSIGINLFAWIMLYTHCLLCLHNTVIRCYKKSILHRFIKPNLS